MIPYQKSAHPMTRLNNSQLGMWLFLSSEVMLFGSLFAVYVALRSANPDFTRGASALPFLPALFATVLLLASSFVIRYHRLAAASLGLAFLLSKGLGWYNLWTNGIVPATSNFWGMFYVFTLLHALHLIGGMVALWIFRRTRSASLELYWHFVDLVWLLIFASFYLL